jgi:hypothetical protein
MAGFFAGKMMRSRMTPVVAEDRPQPFLHPGFQGNLYRLEEQVLDVSSLIRVLTDQFGDHCYRLEGGQFSFEKGADGCHLINIPEYDLAIEADRVILAAGKGNDDLLKKLGRSNPAMQLRPLHMVIARGNLPSMYAHCLGSGTTPRITITSLRISGGDTAWYMGGELAESGVSRSPKQQITVAKQELAEVLPWVDLAGVEWLSLRVDRAEPKTAGGLRPESFFLDSDDGVFTVWPTKLAFAPRLGQEVIAILEKDGITPGQAGLDNLDKLPKLELAEPPWEVTLR